MGNESYVRSVFLAEAHEGTQTGNKMAVLKEKFNSLKLAEPAGGNKDIISEKTGNFFDTFSKGYKSVEHMEEIAGDNNKTETQKQFAMDDLDLLGKVVYDSIRDNEKYKRLIGQGSASEIDENLPKEFKGIGKVVLTNVFEEGPVLETLKELDENKMGLRRMPEGEIKEKRTREMVNKTIRKLANMENLTPGQNHDKEMSLGYLGIELEDVKTEKVKSEKTQEIRRQEAEKNENKSEEGKIVTELQKARKLEEEQIAQKRKEEELYAEARKRSLEQARFETFQAMLLHKNQITLDVFQQYAPEWMKEEKDKPLMQTLVALANSCFYKWKYGDTNLDVMVDPRGEATFNAPNEMMQKMYEIPGVRHTMELIVNDFFEDDLEDGITEEGKEIKVFVLRLKGTDQDKKIKDSKIELKPGEKSELSKVFGAIQNIGDEQTRLVDDLISEGIKKSDAMLAVSTAFNLLYVGHIFEDADINRQLQPCDAYVEQMRAFMFPGTKARSKYGLNKDPITEKSDANQKESVGTEEGWGGQLGQWLTEVAIRARHKLDAGVNENDPDIKFYKQYKKREIHPFPERLFASFFTLTEVEVTSKDEKGAVIHPTMSLAKALYTHETIDFEGKGKGVNPWGSYYDASDSANKLYKIVKGDQKAYPLPLGDRGALQQVANWTHEMSDARKKVRGKAILKPNVESKEFVKWIIAACTEGGLYPYSAELVLMTPNVLANQDLSFDGLLKRRDLLENDKDKEWLKKEFHAYGVASRLTRGRILRKPRKQF